MSHKKKSAGVNALSATQSPIQMNSSSNPKNLGRVNTKQ